MSRERERSIRSAWHIKSRARKYQMIKKANKQPGAGKNNFEVFMWVVPMELRHCSSQKQVKTFFSARLMQSFWYLLYQG